MPFVVDIDDARQQFPQFDFIAALTPSAQKAAFHVRDKASSRDLCLKIISPDYSIDRLGREIHALQAASHPNVVRLEEYTFSSTPGTQRHFIVEEFVPGTDLADLLKPGSKWSRPEVAKTFAQLCDGLAELQNLKIVHRDLKPHNVRVRPDGTPVIIDFGLARLLEHPDITSTRQGAAIGTPLYFAPEQFAGTKRDIDHRTDLFAVGVMLFEALVGRHPFYSAGMGLDLLSKAVCDSADFKSVPEFTALPKEWQLLVSRLLEKQRARRPQGAAQVAMILRKIEGA